MVRKKQDSNPSTICYKKKYFFTFFYSDAAKKILLSPIPHYLEQ